MNGGPAAGMSFLITNVSAIAGPGCTSRPRREPTPGRSAWRVAAPGDHRPHGEACSEYASDAGVAGEGTRRRSTNS